MWCSTDQTKTFIIYQKLYGTEIKMKDNGAKKKRKKNQQHKSYFKMPSQCEIMVECTTLSSTQFCCKFQVHPLEEQSPFHCMLQRMFSLALGQKNSISHVILNQTMSGVVLWLILKRASVFLLLSSLLFLQYN